MKMNMKDIMKQAQEMQMAMAKKQEELSRRTFEASAGGGMVTAVVNGNHELLKLTMDPSIVSKDEIEMLEDLVVAAVNEGFKKAKGALQEEMAGMMGGLGNLQNMFG